MGVKDTCDVYTPMPNQRGQKSWETDSQLVWDAWESLTVTQGKNKPVAFRKTVGSEVNKRMKKV